MGDTILFRRDTPEAWTSVNPILLLGEPGLELGTRKIKYGDGITPWNDLPYSASSGGTDQDLSGLVPKTTSVNGKPLSADIIITKSDVGLDNVNNTSDLSKPISTATQTALDSKANSSSVYTKAETDTMVDASIAALVDTAPEALNTLNELATALGNDPNFATTLSTSLGNKVDKVTGKALSTEDYTTVEKDKVAALDSTYAPISKGVTNGDAHDHSGGDGGPIAYSSLSGKPIVPKYKGVVGGAYQDVEGQIFVGSIDPGSSLGADDLWIDSSKDGTVATDPIWSDKGDLVVGTGVGSAVKLPVGTNGYSLVADSSEASGLKWASVSTAGTGTVTSVGITAPPAGITASGPITTEGVITIGLANDLAAIEGLATTGYVKRTATDTWTTTSPIPGSDTDILTFKTVAVSGQTSVVADTLTDTLTLAAGTGITIATDATTDTITITATGAATPGPHASSHVTNGNDVISNAVASGNSGLMSGSDKAKLDGIQSEAKAEGNIVHQNISGAGTNTHAQIDTHIAATNPHSGAQPKDATLTSLAAITTAANQVILATGVDTFTSGQITDAYIATANKDGIAGTASLRTIGTGAQQAAAGNHNHVGTYEVPLTISTGLTRTGDTLTVNTSQNISTLSNLITNGFIKTSGSNGTLSIDTATYLASNGSAANLTNFPTLNQNTTGTAANLSGTPLLPSGTTATTQAVDDNSTKLATTAFVLGQLSIVGDGTPVMDGTAARGVSTHNARADHVHPADTNLVPKTITVNGHALSGNINVTASDVGNATAQWNASQIRGINIDSSAMTSGDYLSYDGSNIVHAPISTLGTITTGQFKTVSETTYAGGTIATNRIIVLTDGHVQTYTLNGTIQFTLPTANALGGNSWSMIIELTYTSGGQPTWVGIDKWINTDDGITATVGKKALYEIFSTGGSRYGMQIYKEA